MFEWLRRKIKLEQINSGLISAFTKIKEDLHLQKKVLEELHNSHHGFRRHTSANHQRIAEWIKHFDVSINKLDNEIKVLENRLNDDFEKLANASLNLFQEAYAKNIKDAAVIKKEILKEVEVFLKETGRNSEKVNVANVSNVKTVMQEPHFDSLSNPEKWLVGVLFSTETPLSYSQIAERTGKTLNTIRVYMNQLKIKGFIDESTLPNGIKIFSLRHKAKVKKLYNL